MNKIFKVIWNNAKHCYVVASELAKSYSRGGGSRSIRRAAIALGVTAAVYAAAGNVLANDGGDYDGQGNYFGKSNTNPPYTVTIDSDVTGDVYGHKEDSENVEEASVTMTDGIVNNSVYGGYSYSGNAASNSVNISGGTIYDDVYGGLSSEGAAASNSVTISGGNIGYNENGGDYAGNVFGGRSLSGNVSSNSVDISRGTVSKNVYGGYVEEGSGNADYNSVSISSSVGDTSIADSVYGGYSYSGNLSSNSVTISGGTINSEVYGGFSFDNGNAVNNSVNIKGGNVFYVIGGFSDKGTVASNSVNISGGTIYDDVYGGGVNHGSGAATTNSVSISGGTVNHDVYGGYVYYSSTSGSGTGAGAGASVSNIVNISGGNIKQNLYGGCSYTRDADSNYVNISGGTIGYVENSINYGGTVYGGWSESGDAASNSVDISGDTTNILGNIYGGVASSTGIAYENKVNIATGTLNFVYGGYSESGNTASNSVDISGDLTNINEVYGGSVTQGTGSASYNIVNISGGSVREVYGGRSYSGNAASNTINISGGSMTNVLGGYSVTGKAASNTINISNGTVGDATGGYSNSGNAASNSINISGGTINNAWGGGSYFGKAETNFVNIEGGEINTVYGGYSDNTGNITDNKVIIIGGLVHNDVYGGYSKRNNAASNSVNISGESTQIDGSVYGGAGNVSTTNLSHTGSASYNLVSISGSKIGGNVYGGFTINGDTASNSVTISSGTIGMDLSKGEVYGGYVKEGTGVAVSNSVTINNGTVNQQVIGGYSYSGIASNNSIKISGGSVTGYVYGGFSNTGDTLRNSVNISGGTVEQIVYGGFSNSGNTSANSVSISGGTFGSESKIYAGYVCEPNNSTISDNVVNLDGTATELNNTEIYGYYFESNSGTHSGNELHLGGTKTFDSEGNPVVNIGTVWQGKTGDGSINNKVKTIANFETIALHSVAWNETLSALAAESFIFDNNTALGGNVTLDITSLTFDKDNPLGTMTLLQSDTDKNFRGIKLKYSDDAAIAIPVEGKTLKLNTTQTTAKGIKFTSETRHTLSLTDNDKKIDYTIADGYKKAELGGMKWSDGGHTFSNTDNIYTDGLKVLVNSDFNIDGSETQEDDTQLILLDLSQTSGNIKESVDTTKIVEIQKNATSEMTFEIAREDKVKSDSEKKKVIYTVGKNNTVAEVVFNSAIDWNSETPYYSNTSYDFTKTEKIDASKLEFSFTNDQLAELSDSSIMTLVSNASNQPDEVEVTYKNDATNHSQEIDYVTDNGAALSGTMTGVINTSNSEIKFNVNQTTLNSISLDEWDEAKEAAALLEGWSANSEGVKITADTFNPTVTTGEKIIITASTDMFKDENIDETIRYKKYDSFNGDSVNGVILSGYSTGGVKASNDGMKLTYHAMSKDVSEISFGSMKWGEGRTFNSNGAYDFKNVTKIDASDLSFTNPEEVNGSMELVSDARNLEKGKAVTGSSHIQNFDTMLDNKAVVSATLSGEVSVEDEKVKYVADGITINKFNLADWDGEKASSVNSCWKLAESTTVETDGMSNLPDSDEEKQVFILKSDTEGYFSKVAINGENAYRQKQFTDSDEAERVVLEGTQSLGVTLDSAKTNLVYKVGSKDITSFKLNTIAWEDGAEILSRDKYNYSKLTSLDTKDFNITYEKPETVAANQSMTLLKANETLADMAAIDNPFSYQYEPVSGVIMDAMIRNSLEAKSGKVTLKAVSNKADKLTFSDIEWLDKGALLDHKTILNNISFDGADVDTTKIAFTNKQKLDADMQMTLVSDFGDSVGTITGSKYKVGTAYEGEGSAYLDGSDLVFKTKTSAGVSEQTHSTAMAMEAGTAILAAGSEHIGNAIEGLGYAANTGSDGVSTFASVGGNTGRYETGSHVDTNSWNCTLVVGRNLEKRDGTMEYGVFAEYGRGNYTLHMDGVDNAGSGNTHYTGGGMLMKWINSHNVYTEASFRMGNMKDNASGILHDGAGNAYGYDIKAKYRGGHFGIGKTYKEDENTKLDIYGKYFYNEREGINFAAGADQYRLDEVRSRVLRAGFRLSSTDKKWNRYGGIAYDYELDGESKGTVNGTQIRSASIKGGTLRGEFGYCREATKDNPWKTDISLYGFTGKRQGFGGNIAFEYHF